MTYQSFKDTVKCAIKEFILMYSSRPSLLSKKRFEGGFAYWIAQVAMITWFIVHIRSGISIIELLEWVGAEFLIDGYNIYHTQKEKSLTSQSDGADKQNS